MGVAECVHGMLNLRLMEHPLTLIQARFKDTVRCWLHGALSANVKIGH